MIGLLLAPGEGGVDLVSDARAKPSPVGGKTRVIDVRHCRGSLKFLRGFELNLVGNRIGVEIILSPTFICRTVVYGYFKLSQSFGRSRRTSMTIPGSETTKCKPSLFIDIRFMKHQG